MNVKNNKRRQQSREKIEKVFIELLQTTDISRITVSDICKRTGLNRSTFYANYTDIYELADSIKESLENQVVGVYSEEWESKTHTHDFLKLFRHIRENQIFYKTFFKLDYDNTYQSVFLSAEHLAAQFDDDYLPYHIEFFKNGLNAIIKKWLAGGCRETPEQMCRILESEYRGRT